MRRFHWTRKRRSFPTGGSDLHQGAMILRSFREIQAQSVRKEGSYLGLAVVGDLYVVGRLWQDRIPACESDAECKKASGNRCSGPTPIR